MVKVNVEVPDEVHLFFKQLQLDLEMMGNKHQLKQLYADAIRLGAGLLKPQLEKQPNQ